MTDRFVFKFGGTSVKDAPHLARVSDIITDFESPLVVVTSAAAGVTDTLQNLSRPEDLPRLQRELTRRHLELAANLELGPEEHQTYRKQLHDHVETLRFPTDDPSRAALMATGERLMGPLLAALLRSKGRPAVYLDGSELIHTDQSWLAATVDFGRTQTQIESNLAPIIQRGLTPVVPGFVAGDGLGHTTTLGRNGSDYSASILGRCLQAREVWIWTDVDGIYTADPRHHSHARLIKEISFRESAEAAYFGAKVVHPYTMWPLIETDTALRIKNTLAPRAAGTLICRSPQRRSGDLMTTSIKGVAVVTIGGYGMIGVPGVAQKVFTAISDCRTNVLMISQSSSEHNISLVIREGDLDRTIDSLHHALREWIDQEHRVDRIRVLRHVAILSVVGENMRGRVGIAGTIFSALGDACINVIAIAQGSSEYSISIVVEEADLHRAIDVIVERTGHRFGG